MYARRKIILNLIQMLGSATSLKIQKLTFLYIKEFYSSDSGPYQFFPNIRGCYSVVLSNDYHALEKVKLLEKNIDGSYMLSFSTNITNYEISEKEKKDLKFIVTKYGSLPDSQLIKLTYEQKPFYAIRSEIVNSLGLNNTFFENMNKIKNKINLNPTTIYTIGYEGKTIDQIIRLLIYKNIKTLIDVRKNAFSMRREFSKSNLIIAMKESGIEYIHCPEVGIETEKRNELLPKGKRKELFEWYSKNVLENKFDFVRNVRNLLSLGSVAFLCYEKNPNECHRSYLATFCKNILNLDEEIVNL